MTREQIRAAVTDPIALVCTLYGEAANQPIQGIVGVGCAIRNRVLADLGGDGQPDWWGEGFAGVCLKSAQFSCWWEQHPNTDRVYQLAEALIARQPVGEGNLLAELRWIAAGLIENQIRDHVRGATHYVTSALYTKQPPAWTRGRAVVATMGAHVFFRA